MNRVYVGNLPYSVDPAQLAEMFAPAGTVTDSAVPLNDQRRSKGFGFVSFETEEGMKKAIEMFDGKDVGGRVLRVNEARPREDRGGNGGMGGGMGGGMSHSAPHSAPAASHDDMKADDSADMSDDSDKSDKAEDAKEDMPADEAGEE